MPMTAPTDSELYHCRDCRVYDPDNQRSVRQDAERLTDEEWAAKYYVVMVYTGQYAYGQRLSCELALCARHREQVASRT